MAEAARKRATYADLARVPPNLVAEIIGGTLRTHPRPSPPHARAAARLTMRLGRAFDDGLDGPGGWWILDEPEVHLLGDEVVVPDLAGWRLERMPKLPETAWFDVVPDWICEVLSPSTAAGDRADKMPLYASAGVAHVWLVDPVLQTLEAYRRVDGDWMLCGTFRGDARVRAEPFDAVELELAALWSPPAPARPAHE